MHPSRRAVLAGTGLLPFALPLLGGAASPAWAEPEGLIRRPIPSSGETLPAIGIGTSRRYEVEPTPDKIAPLREAVRRFVALGGSVIDTAPSYGTAEDVLGLILAEPGLREKVFLCSKVGTPGREAGAAERPDHPRAHDAGAEHGHGRVRRRLGGGVGGGHGGDGAPVTCSAQHAPLAQW